MPNSKLETLTVCIRYLYLCRYFTDDNP